MNWLDFADEIKNNNRFFPQGNRVLEYIDEILDKNIYIIEKGTKLFRARLTELSNMAVTDGVLRGFNEKDSMAPDPKIATAQRASPSKISYLYVAQDEYTALSEIRPGILSFISFAEISVLEEIKVFDLWTNIGDPDISMSDFEQLAVSFASVISERDKEIDYLPMQYISEYIKNKGVDGIRYVSFQSYGGKNIVLFGEEKVKFIQSKILYAQSVEYSFLNLSNTETKPLSGDIAHKILPKDFSDRIKLIVSNIRNKGNSD